jgi:hypothetical protein
MRVLSESDVLGLVADEPRKARANRGRLCRCSLPFVVDVLRGIEPRTLLCLESNIGPGLM